MQDILLEICQRVWIAFALLGTLFLLSCSGENEKPYTMKPQVLTNLQAFRAKNKFADSEWKKRGLNPSAGSLSLQMNSLFNDCADELIKQVANGTNERKLKLTLLAGLEKFDSWNYDTEEKEFIVDYFYGLSQFIEVDIKEELNSWLYGSLLTTMMQAIDGVKGREKVIETLVQSCTKCQVKLKVFILEKQKGVPSAAFGIVQCPACGELNLIEVGDDVKRMEFDNYKVLEHLPRKQYTVEKAQARLEQLKLR
jgi:hypothetical protein